MQTELNQHTDVILRSSDKELLYSWKILLSISSPVFRDMFTLPQPDADDVDELPVIDLEEDSCTLGHILSLCHPPSCTGKVTFKVDNVRELGAVLEATAKYDMGNTRRVALEELSNPSLLRQDPLGVYALACQAECHEGAKLAAKHTLTLPSLVREYVPELEKIHAGKLCRLLLYREACMAAASSLAADHTWIDLSSFSGCDDSESDEPLEYTSIKHPPSRKYRSGRVERVSVHRWWAEYMRKSEYALRRSPHCDAVKDEKLMEEVLTAISTSKCKECKESNVSEAFRSFVHTFAKTIERRVAEVEIDLGF